MVENIQDWNFLDQDTGVFHQFGETRKVILKNVLDLLELKKKFNWLINN